ncbi:hypothetical protein [Kitasatospora cineracea]|uniref:Uncharacterized protein n=1 Tax=Kitasatospora cineracea TaxID=88074 RepID=A0A8G1X8I4_9ACTN|nr:hypothetical protein [Kitasatospora cineracea]ROR37802.1 hypothetical protein EDD39_5957 [Kitasatospora cineracea]
MRYAFFRAPDPAAVLAAFVAGPARHDPAAAFDARYPSGAEAGDVLDLLDELLLPLPDTGLVERTVWPPTTRSPTCFAVPGDPWTTGPWAHQLSPAARDLLARSPAGALRALRPYGQAPPAAALAVLAVLAALARRAAAAGEQLYYWLGAPPPSPPD